MTICIILQAVNSPLYPINIKNTHRYSHKSLLKGWSFENFSKFQVVEFMLVIFKLQSFLTDTFKNTSSRLLLSSLMLSVLCLSPEIFLERFSFKCQDWKYLLHVAYKITIPKSSTKLRKTWDGVVDFTKIRATLPKSNSYHKCFLYKYRYTI